MLAHSARLQSTTAGRKDGRDLRQPVVSHLQSRPETVIARVLSLLSPQSRAQSQGTVQAAFRMGLPTSINLIKAVPRRHAHRPTCADSPSLTLFPGAPRLGHADSQS